MKKISIFILVCLLSFGLLGCSHENNIPVKARLEGNKLFLDSNTVIDLKNKPQDIIRRFRYSKEYLQNIFGLFRDKRYPDAILYYFKDYPLVLTEEKSGYKRVELTVYFNNKNTELKIGNYRFSSASTYVDEAKYWGLSKINRQSVDQVPSEESTTYFDGKRIYESFDYKKGHLKSYSFTKLK